MGWGCPTPWYTLVIPKGTLFTRGRLYFQLYFMSPEMPHTHTLSLSPYQPINLRFLCVCIFNSTLFSSLLLYSVGGSINQAEYQCPASQRAFCTINFTFLLKGCAKAHRREAVQFQVNFYFLCMRPSFSMFQLIFFVIKVTAGET